MPAARDFWNYFLLSIAGVVIVDTMLSLRCLKACCEAYAIFISCLHCSLYQVIVGPFSVVVFILYRDYVVFRRLRVLTFSICTFCRSVHITIIPTPSSPPLFEEEGQMIENA